MVESGRFQYAALDSRGRRTTGDVVANGIDAAFESLRSRGLTPVKIRPARKTRFSPARSGSLNDRQISLFATELAALLRAGADMRSALNLLGSKSNPGAVRELARRVVDEISGGTSVSDAFALHVPARHSYIGALVMAGEASGDLAGGLERAGEMLENRLKTRDHMIALLSYPAFVLVSALVGLAVILLFVVPPLAPLAHAPGAHPGLPMRILLGSSTMLQAVLPLAGLLAAISLAALLLSAVFGVLKPAADRLVFWGPPGVFARPIVYGGFAVALGGILAAGAPVSDAIRIALDTTRSSSAQATLRPVLAKVKAGEALSSALASVRGMPTSIVRLTVIGEESGSMGPMLERGGRLEEQAAFRRIESVGRLLGPALIVGLGVFVGVLMTGLLSGVAGLGDAALT